MRISARPRHGFALLVVVCALLAGCAASIVASPAQLLPLGEPAAEITFPSEVGVRLSTGYTRAIPAASRWVPVGRVAQGAVYRPVGTVFAVEGRNVHEAYLVVQGASLRGFYLPGEARFSPLDPPVSLPLGGRP